MKFCLLSEELTTAIQMAELERMMGSEYGTAVALVEYFIQQKY